MILKEIKTYIFSDELLEKSKSGERDFTRDRVLTFPKLIVFMLNFIKKSLQLEIYNFVERLSLSDVTKQAFSKARMKLLPIAFQLLNQKFVTTYYSNNSVKTFKGLRVLAVDGSSLRLPRDKQLYKEYGCDTENNGVPLAKVSILFDVLNNITLDSKINPFLSSERDMANSHIQQLLELEKIITQPSYQNDLIMFDRGYQSLFIMYYLLHIKKHFLMRVTEKFLVEIRDFITLNLKDEIVSINAFSKDRRRSEDFKKYLPNIEKLPITVRVLVFPLSSGETEVIITSLIDKDQFPSTDIFNLYSMRWGIEENYKYYKSITELENFSGKTSISIQQDFFATVFASNIHMSLKEEALDELRIEGKRFKYDYNINKNILVGVIKNEIIDILLQDCNLEVYCNKLKSRIKKNLVSIRPNRSYPRIFKRVRSTIKRRAL